MTSRRVYALFGLILFAVVLLVTGHMDLDWMIVAPRFNSWYFSVDFWEFAPYFRLNWHLAYVYTTFRVAIGWLIIGYILAYLKRMVDSS